MKANTYLFTGSTAFLLVAGYCVYRFYPKDLGNTEEAMALSAVVLTGLFLIVLLMAALVIVYQVLGLSDSGQALALPEGSVRALLALSLVLVFVCLAGFLYNEVNHVITQSGSVKHITDARLTELKADFVVVYEPERNEKNEQVYEQKKDATGVLVVDADKKPVYDTTKPLYIATYYTKRSKDADDFAKQIFTTLATIFVSVISFYFGSSATSSGVGAGAKAAKDGGDGGKKTDPQSALSETKAAAHDAQTAADRAAAATKSADDLASKAPTDKASAARSSADKVKSAANAAIQAANDAKMSVEDAQKAVTDATAAGTDATKASAAAAAAFKARDAARASADKAKQNADEAERLVKEMGSNG
jgi:hypothetical protein